MHREWSNITTRERVFGHEGVARVFKIEFECCNIAIRGRISTLSNFKRHEGA